MLDGAGRERVSAGHGAVNATAAAAGTAALPAASSFNGASGDAARRHRRRVVPAGRHDAGPQPVVLLGEDMPRHLTVDYLLRRCAGAHAHAHAHTVAVHTEEPQR